MDTSDTGSAKATVYIETSLVSYLTARPSRDLLVAAHQHLTAAWWDHQRHRYELFTSQVVLTEAGAGDPEAAQRHLAAHHRTGAASASGPGRIPPRHCLRPRDGVSPDVELHASG